MYFSHLKILKWRSFYIMGITAIAGLAIGHTGHLAGGPMVIFCFYGPMFYKHWKVVGWPDAGRSVKITKLFGGRFHIFINISKWWRPAGGWRKGEAGVILHPYAVSCIFFSHSLPLPLLLLLQSWHWSMISWSVFLTQVPSLLFIAPSKVMPGGQEGH